MGGLALPSSMHELRAKLTIKTIALLSMVVHLTILTIVLHMSRIRKAPGSPSYKSSSAVILTEAGKMISSFFLAARDLNRERREQQPGYAPLFESEDADRYNDRDEAALLKSHEKAGSVNDINTQLDRPRNHDLALGAPPSAPLWRIMLRECLGEGYMKLAIPALLFTIQNNLQYVASSNLSVPTFQITYQLKIPFTALCSVLLLGRVLSRKQWGTIGLLAVGVAIVQLSVQSSTITHHHDSHTNHPEMGKGPARLARRADADEQDMNQALGLMAVVISCLCSGFACVYFEKQLKKPVSAPSAVQNGNEENGMMSTPLPPPRPTNLWIKNIQMSFFALIVGTFIYILETFYSSADSLYFFTGFTSWAWVVVGLQIGGGLLAALVIKHADNIAKVFATSVSIILSFVASIPLFDYKLTLGAVVGGATVVGSTYLFAMAEQEQSAASKGPVGISSPRQPPIQLSNLSNSSMEEDEEEDIDRAIDELERSSSSDSLYTGKERA